MNLTKQRPRTNKAKFFLQNGTKIREACKRKGGQRDDWSGWRRGGNHLRFIGKKIRGSAVAVRGSP